MSIILRDYQKEIETQIYKKWNEKSNRLDGNKKSILVQSPTGSGKTRIFSDIANKAEKKGSTVLILTHREELLSQTGGSLVEIGLFPSLVTRDVKHPPKDKLVVGMIETVIRRLKQPEWIEWYKSVNLVINDECFTADTELLTENGFIKFDRLDKSKKVAQFDNGNISFVNPTRYIQKEHTGEMSIFHVKHGIDVPMTCGHEQLLYSRKNGYYKNKISEIKFNYTKLLPVSGLSNIECDELTDLERLYIATQADGSMHYKAINHTIIAFAFSKKRKIDRFLSLCKSCDIEVVKVECNHGERYMARMPIGTTKDIRNHIPYPMSATKAKQVIEECALWDGHTPNKTMLYYSSTDKTQADFYNSVATLAGFCCFMSIQKDDRQERYKDTHRLYMRRDIIHKATQLMSVKKDSYNGMVYCVEVPSGAIVVRHNGFTFVSGNCHEQLFNRIFEIPLTKEKFILGFTATPERSGKQRQLSQDYEDIVIGLDVQQLINLGYLVPDKYYSIPVDMKGVSVSKGEFDSSEMFNRYNKSELYSGVIDNWKRLCPNTITLVFCCNIQHSINTCKALNDAGIKSKFIVSDLAKPQIPDEKATKGDIAKYNIKVLEYENYLVSFESFSGKRKDVIQQWKDGEFHVLINAGIATTGFDHPPIETVIINRATMSSNLLQQMEGRGSRIFKNKTHFNLLDFGDNCSRLGYYRQQREWSLTHEESKKEGCGVGAVKDCPKCGALIHASSRICKYCGYVFPITHEQKIVDLVEISYSEAVKKLESIKDYEIYSEAKGYSKNWLFRQVFIKYGKDGLIEYAKTHNFPQNWVYIQIARYNAQGLRK